MTRTPTPGPDAAAARGAALSTGGPKTTPAPPVPDPAPAPAKKRTAAKKTTKPKLPPGPRARRGVTVPANETAAASRNPIGQPGIILQGWSGAFEWTIDSPAGRYLAAMAAGNYSNQAAEYAGLSPATITKWKTRAHNAWPKTAEGEPIAPAEVDLAATDPQDRPYVAFVATATRAEARVEVELVTLWRGHAKDDYRAARDLLKARQPSRWNGADKVEVTGAGGGPVQVDVQVSKVDRLLADDPVAALAAADLAVKLAQAAAVADEDG